MRKRLRKKKHLGEFQEFGVEVDAKLKEGVDFDTFLDDFLADAMEANDMYFGGGGSETDFSGYVKLGRRQVHLPNIQKLKDWLAQNRRQTLSFEHFFLCSLFT